MKLPDYAKDMLWITSGGDFQTQVPDNLQIEVDNPIHGLTLRWGTSEGSPMRHWPTVTKNIVWNGHVRVAGHVECLHLMTFDELELLVVELRGSLLPMERPRFPSLEDLKKSPFERDIFIESESAWYSFLLEADNPMTDFVHHALVNGYSMDCYGKLADDASGFHHIIGMPMLLESLTLYAG